jgi:hypothetical protein
MTYIYVEIFLNYFNNIGIGVGDSSLRSELRVLINVKSKDVFLPITFYYPSRRGRG